MSFEATVAGDAYPVVFRQSGNNVCGSIVTNNSQTYYQTTSDYRLKNDLGPVLDARSRMLMLRPIIIEWKSEPGTREASFYAHEVQSVIPNAVRGEKDAVDADGKIIAQQLDKSAMIPDIVAALRDEIKLTNHLRDTILQDRETFTQTVSALVGRIEALEQNNG